jgi:hypothetical protein
MKANFPILCARPDCLIQPLVWHAEYSMPHLREYDCIAETHEEYVLNLNSPSACCGDEYGK